MPADGPECNVMDQTSADVSDRLLWATPTVTLLVREPARLTQRLEEIILAEEAALTKRRSVPVAGLRTGLTTQWLEYNVLHWNYPEIAELRSYILVGIRKFIGLFGDPDEPKYAVTGISCWANVLRFGESLHVHHHDPAFVSAHFLVKSGYDYDQVNAIPDAGNTVYYRPGFMERSHGGEAAASPSPWDHDWQISSRPEEGKLFLFPSYVRHEVRPYLGSTCRISIALDVFVKHQRLPIYFGGPRWYVPQAGS
jgi:uncharacterized protein (TIGR02466 family)